MGSPTFSHLNLKTIYYQYTLQVYLKYVTILPHETILRTGVTCKKTSSLKSIEFGMSLKSNVACYKQNIEMFFVIRPLTW